VLPDNDQGLTRCAAAASTFVRPGRYGWVLLLVLATFYAICPLCIVSVALPEIGGASALMRRKRRLQARDRPLIDKICVLTS
jgi:hypothetical protein